MTDEPKRVVYLGTVDVREGEIIGLSVPAGLDLDAATIAAAIEEAEAEKLAAAARLARAARDVFEGRRRWLTRRAAWSKSGRFRPPA